MKHFSLCFSFYGMASGLYRHGEYIRIGGREHFCLWSDSFVVALGGKQKIGPTSLSSLTATPITASTPTVGVVQHFFHIRIVMIYVVVTEAKSHTLRRGLVGTIDRRNSHNI